MRVPTVGRRRLAATAATLACAVVVSTQLRDPAASQPIPRHAAGLDDAGYLAVADELQRHLDPLWNAQEARYEPGPGSTDTEVNADLLVVHSLAALSGHRGPARSDARARAIARFLVSRQVWTGGGWLAVPGRPNRHLVFDVEAIDGLVHAYLARDAIGLDAATVTRIRQEIHTAATSREWAFPALRLNQINWYCAVYAADAIVNGERRALAAGMGGQLARFAAGVAPHGTKAGNLGPGLHFHYLPDRGPRAGQNVDSAEYANIVLSFSRFYDLARRSGMPQPRQSALLRDWVRRVLAGYWTHSGYQNWDTGLGFARWHQRKKAALTQLALIGVASADELQPGPEWGSWAKWMLDRGLLGYDALVRRERAIPAALAYGVDTVPQSRANAYLAAARYAANAVRAVEAGLGRRCSTAPPALYSFDPDTGRLAVTTPTYNTAIVPVNQRSIPYGGVELARLFDARQEVAANIGGSGLDAFGLTARAHGRVLLATQYGDRGYGTNPLRLDGVDANDMSRRPHAGPFRALRAHADVRAHGLRATTRYRFTPGAIEARWTLRASRAVDAAVTFPSWGAGAHVVATLRDGRTVTLGAAPIALAEVMSLRVVSERGGYRITPLQRPAGATVGLVATRPQPSDPHPGPTTEVRHVRSFAVRMVISS
ncbi:hypothetical protein [Solirubrobacter soli]|uniref:hypothetical protein n=1 Tax=Solirubrobacter soli TaxID=363832 RepID=UPI00040AA40C|nr:hypothetical protein [Solirubrobacter soli]